MRDAPRIAGLAALVALLLVGFHGTLFGGMLAAGEVQRAPAVLVVIALMVLQRGPGALPAAGGWAVLGAAGAVALRGAFGVAGEAGWIPGEVTSAPETLSEAAWLMLLALLAWRATPAGLLGPLMALMVATTRIGAYGLALVPLLWEETLREAMLLSTSVVAGFAAGVLVVLLAGWCLAIVAGISARWVAPARLIAALAALAAIGHMLQLCPTCL